MDYLSRKLIDLVINIPKNSQEEELTNDYLIRRRAVDFGVPLITDIQLAQRFVEALARKGLSDLQIKSGAEYAYSPLRRRRVIDDEYQRAVGRPQRRAAGGITQNERERFDSVHHRVDEDRDPDRLGGLAGREGHRA